MHKDKRVEKKKTVVMKRCLNPVFNESFPFDVPAHVLRETTIIITVMDKDRLSRNDVIGKVSPSLFFACSFFLFFSSSVFFWLCDRQSAVDHWASLYWPLLELADQSSAVHMNEYTTSEIRIENTLFYLDLKYTSGH